MVCCVCAGGTDFHRYSSGIEDSSATCNSRIYRCTIRGRHVCDHAAASVGSELSGELMTMPAKGAVRRDRYAPRPFTTCNYNNSILIAVKQKGSII